MNLFTELKRRHVFRIGIAYLVVAWLVLQVVNVLAPILGVPMWVSKAILLVLIAGFPVALILAWAFEMTPEGVKRTGDLEEAAPKRSVSSGRKLDFVIIGLMAIALLYFGWRQYYGTAPRQTAEQGSTTTATATATAMPSLAVLPFANLSDDKKQDYFADGLSEELLDKLANLKGLEVTGRTSSFYFKGKNEDLRVIGEKLGVENLLEGSVRKSGDQLRITAQLINAKTGYHLWSETYDRKLEDIFSIQDDISKSVATALSVTLGVGDLGRIEGGTRNVAAYDAYLKGQFPANSVASTALFRSLIDSLERAVKLDPSYALAWASISSYCRTAAAFDDAGNGADWREKADNALARARDLAPGAVAVLAESAVVAAARGNWVDAERTYRKAISLHGDAALAQDYGVFLGNVGKARKAVDYLVEARRIEPLDPEVAHDLGEVYLESGKTAEAIAEFDRSVRLGGDPSESNAFELYAALIARDREEIRRRIGADKKLDDIGTPIHQAMQPFLGHPEGVTAELRRLYRDPANASPLGKAIIAIWAAYFGNNDFALAALKGIASNGFTNIDLTWSPVYHNMRTLPGFKDVVRQIGLVDYWRQYGWGDFCHPVGDNDFECE
jgi:TolB-like protein